METSRHQFGIKVRQEKCELFRSEVEYLGYVIDAQGKRPSDNAVKAIKEMPAPTNLSQLHYGRFIENLSKKAAPLYALTHQDAVFEWTTHTLRLLRH